MRRLVQGGDAEQLCYRWIGKAPQNQTVKGLRTVRTGNYETVVNYTNETPERWPRG
jgi:hypothetical protein